MMWISQFIVAGYTENYIKMTKQASYDNIVAIIKRQMIEKPSQKDNAPVLMILMSGRVGLVDLSQSISWSPGVDDMGEGGGAV